MEMVVTFYYLSTRTYQLKSPVIFQHLQAFILKLIFIRNNGCYTVPITRTKVIPAIMWMLITKTLNMYYGKYKDLFLVSR